ncbi:hypothetical protein LRS74_17305 [Streptomyces sp. LX-29]|uniref:hypothetical protein n=1 Tax=Streptomyces sp. LX-29 TaxID=2900152 RepID=UPI00240E1777|nr:hypothetical protein [Streptomyces sp. LX-29]WFB08609.1 hypothetical protein LRS74_17305 [Streptomyces sp. LX-29]
MERSRRKQALRTRWDGHKLDAYAEYIGRVRSSIHASVLLYEVREEMRTVARTERELEEDLTSMGIAQALAFERVMLLAGDEVIEVAHSVQEATAAIGWQARGVVDGTLAAWRQLHTVAFEAINRFHERARYDLGVSGDFDGQQHTARGLLLPNSRAEVENDGS